MVDFEEIKKGDTICYLQEEVYDPFRMNVSKYVYVKVLRITKNFIIAEDGSKFWRCSGRAKTQTALNSKQIVSVGTPS